MKPEIEAKFVNIDKTELRAKLQQVSAKLVQPEILMRRTVFDTGKDSFIRVRDEGKRIEVTYKRIDELTITGAKEINLYVDDYDRAIEFIKVCGRKVKAEQETLREKWKLDDVEIDIDTWPWIPSTVEIEGQNELDVAKVVKKLGFDMQNAHYGSIDKIYKLYYDVTDDDINYCPEIKFTPVPEWLEKIGRAHV